MAEFKKVIRQTNIKDGETIDATWAMTKAQESYDLVMAHLDTIAEKHKDMMDICTNAKTLISMMTDMVKISSILGNEREILRNIYGNIPVEVEFVSVDEEPDKGFKATRGGRIDDPDDDFSQISRPLS